MEYAEIKEKMTQGEWREGEHGQSVFGKSDYIGSDELYELVAICDDAGIHHSGSTADQIVEECKANAHAIVTAINNTYGKGINPEAVGELIRALQRLVDVVDPCYDSYPDGSAVEYFFKDPVKQARQALAKAGGKD